MTLAPWLQYLGLAYKAHAIELGDDLLFAIRHQHVYLVLVAEDGGPTSVKRWVDKCTSFKIPLVRIGTKAHIGQALGKEAVTALGINNQAMALKIQQLLKVGDTHG